jgi:glycosyltransferase involved in cell wall biosynthesis
MNIGGPAYHVSLLAGRLDPDRYETLLLTGALGAGEGSLLDLARQYGATSKIVPGLNPRISPLRDLRALVQLVYIILKFRPDIIHTHTAKAGTLGRLAAAADLRRSPVVVHTYHGHVLRGYFGPVLNAIFRTVERVLAHRSTCLIGVSAATVEELVKLRIAPARKFRSMPIGLDLDRFLAIDRPDGDAFRAEIGVDPTEILAIFTGRLVPIKRVELLLEAVAIARASGARLRVAIVGDGELRDALEQRTSQLGLAEAVCFLGFRSDLPAIIAASDLAVLSSESEGTPVALIEAAAGGRPAVATSVGGVSEIVTPTTGLLVRPGDARAFAAALLQLSGDSQARARMGLAARELVRERFAADRLVRDIDALYQELLKRARDDLIRRT